MFGPDTPWTFPLPAEGRLPQRLAPSLDLSLIGNCGCGALIDRHGDIVWWCLPRFDGDPVFHALLGSPPEAPDAGRFAIRLENLAQVEQRYDPGTAILRTRLFDTTGQAIEICDFAPRFHHFGRMFRPQQIVRRVRPLAGRPRISVQMRPRGDWGTQEPVITRGSNHLRFVLPSVTLRLNTSAPPEYVAAGTWFSLHSPVSFMLGPDEPLSGGVDETAREFEDQTTSHWREWTRRLALPLEWQDAVIRAAITLKLCQFEETGAIVAALTTSIPEAPDSGRTWDYRHCWLRDAFFVVRALNSLSEVGTMENYLQWLHDVVISAHDRIQPLYGIGLEPDLREYAVSSLPGFRGMGPVRRGNQAYEHQQHDVYGNIVLGAAQSFHDRRLLRPAGVDDYHRLERIGEQAWKLHDQPDAGMWELRTKAQVHTTSALMCWAACDRLARIATVLSRPRDARRWANRSATIRDRVLGEAWNEHRQAFVGAFGGQELDAGVLLMAEVGFLPASDPRFMSTVDAVQRHLGDGMFLRRYEMADDFGRPETAFNICAFWLVDALARVGRHDEARDRFNSLLNIRTASGLLSEDFDVRSGELWGNFPQTYSMVGIIHGAARLSAPWDSVV